MQRFNVELYSDGSGSYRQNHPNGDYNLREEPMESKEGKFVVRLYDGFDNIWMDVSSAVTKEEADKIWGEKTDNGTRKTKFDDIDYYKIFPADTRMLFR